MSELAPDLVGRVVGFRAWRLVGRQLLSPYIPCRWDGRDVHAVCFDANRTLLRGRGWLTEPHESPHPDCQCGIYAYHRPGVRSYFGDFEWAEGIISVWGRVEAHADGLRAEHARVEALARPARHELALAEDVAAIASSLGVPLCAREELQDVAAGIGGPLPLALRPAA